MSAPIIEVKYDPADPTSRVVAQYLEPMIRDTVLPVWEDMITQLRSHFAESIQALKANQNSFDIHLREVEKEKTAFINEARQLITQVEKVVDDLGKEATRREMSDKNQDNEISALKAQVTALSDRSNEQGREIAILQHSQAGMIERIYGRTDMPDSPSLVGSLNNKLDLISTKLGELAQQQSLHNRAMEEQERKIEALQKPRTFWQRLMGVTG